MAQDIADALQQMNEKRRYNEVRWGGGREVGKGRALGRGAAVRSGGGGGMQSVQVCWARWLVQW
jgi:hypothetical protein